MNTSAEHIGAACLDLKSISSTVVSTRGMATGGTALPNYSSILQASQSMLNVPCIRAGVVHPIPTLRDAVASTNTEILAR